MPYCPKCRDEFREGFNTCPGCKVGLVEQLPRTPPTKPRPEWDKDPLVRIASAPNEAVAGMWKDILENNGIHVLIKKDDLYPYVTFNVSCEIYVLSSQSAEAKQILESLSEVDDPNANDEST